MPNTQLFKKIHKLEESCSCITKGLPGTKGGETVRVVAC